MNYTAYDKPYRIESGAGHVTEFLYGPNRARYVRKDTNTSGELQATFYVGNVEKIVYESGDYTIRRYVAGVGMIVQDYNAFDTALEAEDLRYFYKDHLGSLSIITNAAGNITAQMSFDAFGKRRDHANWSIKLDKPSALSLVTQARTNRGYTGHEQLDEVELIHMNGRVYDANLGRFLSADTFVPDANNLQAYNRYSYVMNNPLNATDPSGHIPCELRAVVAIVVAVVLTVWIPQGANIWWKMAKGALIGAVSGGIASGTWEGAAWGALSGAVFAGIGDLANSEYFTNSLEMIGEVETTLVLTHAVAGGTLSYLQGGKFITGFMSAGISKSVGGNLWEGSAPSDVWGRTMVVAATGGLITKASGGKFANGFLTSGLAHLLNQESSLTPSQHNRAYNAKEVPSRLDPALEAAAGEAANKIYMGEDAPMKIGDYVRVAGSVVVDQVTGFKAATYSHPDGSRLLVFAGTDTEYGGIQFTLDAMDSVAAALTGGFTHQAQQADAYTQTWANGSTTLVGHSLGGGLAAWAGIGTEHTVVAINARGIGFMTGMFNDTSNVYHYYSLSDPLTYGNWVGTLYRWGNEVIIDSKGHSSKSACIAMGGNC